MEKTNVMRLLEQKKIAYTAHTYEADATKTGEEIAALLHLEPVRRSYIMTKKNALRESLMRKGVIAGEPSIIYRGYQRAAMAALFHFFPNVRYICNMQDECFF